MKRIISAVLAAVMLISAIGCISAFASEKKYPPLETQDQCDTILFNEYQFTVAGRDCEPGGLNEIPMLNAEEKSLDEETVNQIIADWESPEPDYEYTAKDITYYGTLSDGSILVNINRLNYFTALNYMIIGKYVYVTPCLGDEVLIYKDHKFARIITAYQNEELSDELLDEIAETLHFAMFVKQSEQVEPDPTEEPKPTTDIPTEPTKPAVPTEPASEIEESMPELIDDPDIGEYTKTLMGDANGDGVLTVKDVTLIQQFIVGAVSEKEIDLSAANVSGSDTITIRDATMVQMMIVGI